MSAASMKIQSVQIVSSIEEESAGPSYSVVRLAEALAARGGHSTLLTLAEKAGDSQSNGVHLRRFPPDSGPLPLPRKLAPSRTMMRAVKAAGNEGALLHVHGLWRMPNVYPGLAAEHTGAPLVASPRGMLGPAALQFSHCQKEVFWQLFQKRALRPVTCFHATATSELDDIRAFGLTAPVAVIPNGIDIPGGESHPGARTVLYLGRLHPKKGVDRLVAAWARVANRYPDWSLRIVGPSEMGCREALERQVQGLRVPRVAFDGPLFGDDKLNAYQHAALLVLPTLNENFGMVVAEALAAGIPVICTKGAPWARLKTERCGWWIDHGVDAMEVALDVSLALPNAARAAMGARGRAWMARDFSWDCIAACMVDVYAWCLGKGDRPDCIVTN